jgi:predicted RNase H-like HicB family nuclease
LITIDARQRSVTGAEMERHMKRDFNVIIERDEEGYLVATVPALRGCHTQARSLDTLMKRVRGAIDVCLEDVDAASPANEFVGVQRVTVEV